MANFSTSDAVSNRRKLETLEIALTHEERQKQQQFIQSPQPQREPASPYSSPEKKNSFSKILTRLENQYQQELREKSIPTQKEKFIAPEPLSPSHNLTETQLNEVFRPLSLPYYYI